MVWRSAVWRFGIGAALLAGCWRDAPIASGPQPDSQISASAAPGPAAQHGSPTQRRESGLLGSYWCSIEDSGYSYPKFPCAIRHGADGVELAKLGGSQRFVGVISPNAEGGFGFRGKFFCPWGACDQPLEGGFDRDLHGSFRGTFSNNSIVVTLEPAEQGAFTGYGGDSYGGASYAGNSPRARPIRARP